MSVFALCGLALAGPAYSQSAQNSTLPVLTTIKSIRALSQDEGARGYSVRVRAIVTHVDERADVGTMIHDGEFGQFMIPPTNPSAVRVWKELQRGDLVEVEGRTLRGGYAPNVQPSTIRRLGQAPLPTPKYIPFAAMLTGRHDCDYVEIVGVVQRAWLSSDPQMHTLFADVAFEDGVVRATFWDYSADDLPRFVDARVRMRGNIGTLFGRTEQLRGVSLFVGHTSDIAVLEPAPNPFWLPTRSIRSIYNYSAAGEVNRRIRVRGVVTSYIPGRPVEVGDFTSTAKFRYVRHVLYVDDGTGGARVETEQSLRVRPGTVVEVAGFPAVTPGKPILTNAVFKVSGDAAQPAPIPIGPANVLTPENDATLVRMEGDFLSILMSPTERILVLKVGETVFDADLDAEAATGALERIRPGSRVSVTGVYSYQWGPPPSFRLFLRSPSDVIVVAAAPCCGYARRRTANGSSIRPSSTNAVVSDASFTTRSSRGSRAFRCSSRRCREAWTRRRRRRASHSTSPGACCGTARTKRAGRSWICDRRRSRARTSRARSRISPRRRRMARACGRTCASTARRGGSTPRRNIICCASASKR